MSSYTPDPNGYFVCIQQKAITNINSCKSRQKRGNEIHIGSEKHEIFIPTQCINCDLKNLKVQFKTISEFENLRHELYNIK